MVMQTDEIAKILHSTRIENIEDIAIKVSGRMAARGFHLSGSARNIYQHMLAQEYARQKLEHSGLPYSDAFYTEGLPFIIREDGGILVAVCPDSLVPSPNKSQVKKISRPIKQNRNGCTGVIQFMPYQCGNGSMIRRMMKSELSDIAFVNMPYDDKALERRFEWYVRGNAPGYLPVSCCQRTGDNVKRS